MPTNAAWTGHLSEFLPGRPSGQCRDGRDGGDGGAEGVTQGKGGVREGEAEPLKMAACGLCFGTNKSLDTRYELRASRSHFCAICLALGDSKAFPESAESAVRVSSNKIL